MFRLIKLQRSTQGVFSIKFLQHSPCNLEENQKSLKLKEETSIFRENCQRKIVKERRRIYMEMEKVPGGRNLGSIKEHLRRGGALKVNLERHHGGP